MQSVVVAMSRRLRSFLPNTTAASVRECPTIFARRSDLPPSPGRLETSSSGSLSVSRVPHDDNQCRSVHERSLVRARTLAPSDTCRARPRVLRVLSRTTETEKYRSNNSLSMLSILERQAPVLLQANVRRYANAVIGFVARLNCAQDR